MINVVHVSCLTYMPFYVCLNEKNADHQARIFTATQKVLGTFAGNNPAIYDPTYVR